MTVHDYVLDALQQLGHNPAEAEASEKHVAQLRQVAAAWEPVLLVLDNVQSVAELSALLPVQLARGSLVIVTARVHHCNFPGMPRVRWQVCGFEGRAG